MRLFEFFRRGQKPASFEALRRGQPDPVFVGDFLVHSFVDSHFGLSDADLKALAAPLPETVRELAGFWITLYLCWILRTKIRAKYGDAFFWANNHLTHPGFYGILCSWTPRKHWLKHSFTSLIPTTP
jgi:hypothetical protein